MGEGWGTNCGSPPLFFMPYRNFFVGNALPDLTPNQSRIHPKTLKM